MREIADIHIHSKYSISTSSRMCIEEIVRFSKIKGVTLVGTGDILFKSWRREIEPLFENQSEGIYYYKNMRFFLTSEVNLVFEKEEIMRKIHLLVIFPSFNSVENGYKFLSRFGHIDLSTRPTIHMTGKDFVEGLKNVDERIHIIPAHIWTPWFGVLGSRSGFDNIEECFEEGAKQIFALETGLSADPELSYMVPCLRSYTMISNSDAHSPAEIGREATIFDKITSYDMFFESLKAISSGNLLATVEYFPEEGKYFADGHRKCKFFEVPDNTERCLCPVCGKPVTIGVYHRVLELSGEDKEKQFHKISSFHVIPLRTLISQALRKGKNSNLVQIKYEKAIEAFGNELNILCFASKEELFKNLDPCVAKFVLALRNGNVMKLPGYDGIFGKINIDPTERSFLMLA